MKSIRQIVAFVTVGVFALSKPLYGEALPPRSPVALPRLLYGVNLLMNGDAEAGVGSLDGSTGGTPVPAWATTGPLIAVKYGIGNSFPAPNDPGPSARGLNFFSGGPSNALSSATQSIDLSAIAPGIDTAQVQYELSGYLGGYAQQADSARFTLTFLDGTGSILGTATIGPVTVSDRGSATSLLFRSTAGSVPATTRSIMAVLTMTRAEGAFNDGYADDLSIVLTPAGATGNLIAPADGLVTGPATMHLLADAHGAGTVSVTSVEFLVLSNGTWRSAGVDLAAPFETFWNTPDNLRSQRLLFGVRVTGSDGNAVSFPDGWHAVDYRESLDQADVNENWVATRYYLNQRAIKPGGECRCNVSSVVMILAMNGVIAPDQMDEKALELYESVTDPNDLNPTCRAGNSTRMTQVINQEGQRANRPVLAQSVTMPGSRESFWTLLKAEIDQDHPVMIGTFVTSAGHIMVIVGYRESGAERELIAYDPYGRWEGTLNQWNENSEDLSSSKGRWVRYDLNTFPLGTFLITTHRTDLGQASAPLATAPTTPADVISDEPETSAEYFGVPTVQNVLIPALMR